MQIRKKSRTFAAEFKNIIIMNTFLKYLGVILLLLGVVCLVVYYFAVPSNALLVVSIVLELVGILSYILINKYLEK